MPKTTVGLFENPGSVDVQQRIGDAKEVVANLKGKLADLKKVGWATCRTSIALADRSRQILSLLIRANTGSRP